MVIFPTSEARDAVRAGAVALGRSTTPCGLRIDIPEHLKSDFKALETTAYRIRTKNRGAKTNIKYDDVKMGLVLDFRVGEGDWLTVDAEKARRVGVGSSGRTDIDEDALSEFL